MLLNVSASGGFAFIQARRLAGTPAVLHMLNLHKFEPRAVVPPDTGGCLDSIDAPRAVSRQAAHLTILAAERVYVDEGRHYRWGRLPIGIGVPQFWKAGRWKAGPGFPPFLPFDPFPWKAIGRASRGASSTSPRTISPLPGDRVDRYAQFALVAGQGSARRCGLQDGE